MSEIRYGVMVKGEIKICNSLKSAQHMREDMIKHNEFSNYIEHCCGGYKIVKLQIEEVEDNDMLP